MKKVLFFSLCYFCLMIFAATSLSISPWEAVLIYEKKTPLSLFVGFLMKISKEELFLRGVFSFFTFVNILLFYLLSAKILKKELDRFFATFLFAFLPGIISSSLIINETPITIFLTLLFLIFYFYVSKKVSYIILFLGLLWDNSFSILFLALFFYSIYTKNQRVILLSLFLFGVSMYIYGFDARGKPQNHFLEALGIYSAIFSPFLFIYFFYAIYRILIKEEKDFVWFLSFTSFMFSLLLSFRQKIVFEDFAPFAVMGIFFVAKVFFSSYRVRIPIYRKKHLFALFFVLFFLVLNDLVLIFNKQVYFFLDNPKKHFAFRFHIAKRLSYELKKMGINCLTTPNKKLKYQLLFYGIKECPNYYLLDDNLPSNNLKKRKKVSIFYKDILLKDYFVSNINNK